jgi:hypothetical protein
MEDSVHNYKIYNKYLKLLDLSKYPIKDFYVIYYGQILKKVLKDGTKTKEESALYSEPMLYQTF